VAVTQAKTESKSEVNPSADSVPKWMSEMFPSLAESEISDVLKECKMNLDVAIERLLSMKKTIHVASSIDTEINQLKQIIQTGAVNHKLALDVLFAIQEKVLDLESQNRKLKQSLGQSNPLFETATKTPEDLWQKLNSDD